MIRSSALRRYSSLRPGKALKRSWLRRKSPRRIARETHAEVLHKALVREMRTCAAAKYAGSGRCWGGLEVAHLGRSGGVGRKHGDWTETSLFCAGHHRAFDTRSGPFARMSPEERHAFADREIQLAREFVAGRLVVSA